MTTMEEVVHGLKTLSLARDVADSARNSHVADWLYKEATYISTKMFEAWATADDENRRARIALIQHVGGQLI